MASMRCSCQTAPLHSQRWKTCCMQHCGIRIMSPAAERRRRERRLPTQEKPAEAAFQRKKRASFSECPAAPAGTTAALAAKRKILCSRHSSRGSAKPKRQQSRFFLPQRVWGKVRTGKYFSEPPLFIIPNESKKLSYVGAPDKRPQSIPLN